MSYFEASPDQLGDLAAAYAAVRGAPRTAAVLTGQAVRDDALGLTESAISLRALADLRVARDRAA